MPGNVNAIINVTVDPKNPQITITDSVKNETVSDNPIIMVVSPINHSFVGV